MSSVMKLNVVGGDPVRLHHSHFGLDASESGSVTIDSLPAEGVLMHHGTVVQSTGMQLSSADIVMGNLVYVSVPGQTESTLFDYTVRRHGKAESSGYIILAPDEARRG